MSEPHGPGPQPPVRRQASPFLDASIHHRLGTMALQATLQLRARWTVLFGPSGSGKSTLLRILAGLIRPDAGRVSLRGDLVVDTAAGVWVPAHRRPVRWAGQRSALFPGKTVRWNVAMGMGKDPAFAGRAGMDELEHALEVFGILELAAERPSELSGGQRQRVSVARAAIGARNRVLLLDEPFSGLDARSRDSMIQSLHDWLGGAPVLFVTHDVAEALLLGSDALRMNDGRIVAQGPVADVLAAERTQLRALLG